MRALHDTQNKTFMCILEAKDIPVSIWQPPINPIRRTPSLFPQ